MKFPAPSKATAKKIIALIKNGEDTNPGSFMHRSDHRWITHVRVTADADGEYPCVPCAYLTQQGAWEEYGAAIVLDANDAELHANEIYLAVLYGYTAGDVAVYVTVAGGSSSASSCCLEAGCGLSISNGIIDLNLDHVFEPPLEGMGCTAWLNLACGLDLDADDKLIVYVPDLAGKALVVEPHSPCDRLAVDMDDYSTVQVDRVTDVSLAVNNCDITMTKTRVVETRHYNQDGLLIDVTDSAPTTTSTTVDLEGCCCESTSIGECPFFPDGLHVTLSCSDCECADGDTIALAWTGSSYANPTGGDCSCDGPQFAIYCTGGEWLWSSCSGYASGTATVVSLSPLELHIPNFEHHQCLGSVCTAIVTE